MKISTIVKLSITIVICIAVSASNVQAHNVHKNSVMIILNEDGKTGYASPKNAVIDLKGNSPVYKVKFTLWQVKDGNLISLQNKDYDMTVNFLDQTIPNQTAKPGNLACINNRKWQDIKPNKPLKKGKRHFMINTNKHNDGDCYTYEIIVDTGNKKISIDPWLRIKR